MRSLACGARRALGRLRRKLGRGEAAAAAAALNARRRAHPRLGEQVPAARDGTPEIADRFAAALAEHGRARLQMCVLDCDFGFSAEVTPLKELAELWPDEPVEWFLRYLPATVFNTDGRGKNCLFQALLLALPAVGVALPPDVAAEPWETRAGAFRRHVRALTEARSVACVPGSDECRRLRSQLQALAGCGRTEEQSLALVAEVCRVHINVLAIVAGCGRQPPCLTVTHWHGGRPEEVLPQVWLLHADDHDGHFRAVVPMADVDAICAGGADYRSVSGAVMQPGPPPGKPSAERASLDTVASSSAGESSAPSAASSSRSLKPGNAERLPRCDVPSFAPAKGELSPAVARAERLADGLTCESNADAVRVSWIVACLFPCFWHLRQSHRPPVLP